MNSAIADTLTPIMQTLRSDAAGAWEVVARFQSTDPQWNDPTKTGPNAADADGWCPKLDAWR